MGAVGHGSEDGRGAKVEVWTFFLGAIGFVANDTTDFPAIAGEHLFGPDDFAGGHFKGGDAALEGETFVFWTGGGLFERGERHE